MDRKVVACAGEQGARIPAQSRPNGSHRHVGDPQLVAVPLASRVPSAAPASPQPPCEGHGLGMCNGIGSWPACVESSIIAFQTAPRLPHPKYLPTPLPCVHVSYLDRSHPNPECIAS